MTFSQPARRRKQTWGQSEKLQRLIVPARGMTFLDTPSGGRFYRRKQIQAPDGSIPGGCHLVMRFCLGRLHKNNGQLNNGLPRIQNKAMKMDEMTFLPVLRDAAAGGNNFGEADAELASADYCVYCYRTEPSAGIARWRMSLIYAQFYRSSSARTAAAHP